ncbi:transposase, partial [bacterium]|nr:transposase [bacterium]
NRETWRVVFEDLITRGLKRVLVIVSDDLPGIIETIEAIFPLADHQLCFVHLQRNVRRHMSKEDATQFNRELSKLKSESSLEEAEEGFRLLCERYKDKYPRFINNIISKAEHYLAFTKYPYEIRKYIYTTNSVENFNSIIEKVRIKSGGYFSSVDNLEINIYLQRENLIQTKWRNPVPRLRAYTYEINQLFQLRYLCLTQNT